MGSLFDDLAFFHHQDQICIPHRRNPVGDDEGRFVFRQSKQLLLDLRFGFHVDRGSGVIQNKDGRILRQCPCQRNTLLLPPRQTDSAFADNRVVSLGHTCDEAIRIGDPGHLLDVGTVHLRIAESDVVLDRIGKQENVLHDHGDVLPQLADRVVFGTFAIDQDGSRSGIVESSHQINKRCLA